MQIYSWLLKLSKWLCIAITVGILISCALIPRSNPLLGTWVSDKEQTLAELAKKPRISDKTRALMDNDFFGKLRITYTPDSYVAALDGEVIRGKYEIIEVNKHFVEIEEYAEGDGEKTRSRIYIDGHFLYVYSPDYNLKEYFRRVK